MELAVEANRTLQRIVKKLDFNGLSASEKKQINARLELHFEDLFPLLFGIYGHRYDFYFHLQELTQLLVDGYKNRSKKLKKHDQQRLNEPDWYMKENMLGMACYVDLFAGDLQKLQLRIPYLQELGITYLHLMPLYLSPDGDSDGGYAVSDYRTVNPELGNVEDLKNLAGALSDAGISLVLDFVFNHTSDEHQWAQKAKSGVVEYQDYYYMFADRTLPDAYEQNLREIFPQVRRGNFTWNEEAQKWVWTTFNSFQWDLNYSNPAVFNAIVDEMLFLANLGCEALRLDALAFIWKEMGTNCENQDKAHCLIKAFNSCLRISAPSVVFKSEAIVHPDEVIKYIDPNECQLSYNPLLMALLWNSLATRKTKLLTQSLRKSFEINPDCAWVNYVRCHDDIGWTFDDGVAWQLGINAHDHRHFLNQFYTGRFEGSFSKGVAFQENPANGDCRVCGSLASLAGLELALETNNEFEQQHAIKRILLLHSVILSIGGIPLLYCGDELGLLNDYSYQQDPGKQHDGRWVNRPMVTDEHIASRETSSITRQIASGLEHMIKIRQSRPLFGHVETQILETNNQHIFAYTRHADNGDLLLALVNFSEHQQMVDGRILQMFAYGDVFDLLSGNYLAKNYIANSHLCKSHIAIPRNDLTLEAYQVMWLVSGK